MGKVRATVARGVRTFNIERAKRSTVTVAERQICAECLVPCATRTLVLSASGAPIYARLSGGSSPRKWSHIMHEPGFYDRLVYGDGTVRCGTTRVQGR